jgi:chromosome segregation ATPase
MKDTPASSRAQPPARITFPPPPPPDINLSLRRRLEPSPGSVEARKSINAIMAATRAPWGEVRPMEPQQVGELQRALQQLEAKLDDREHAMEEIVARLAERERELAETEALLTARENVIVAAGRTKGKQSVSKEERAALERLKAELERQEASLKEQKAALKDREVFVQDNETKLFENMQEQQEREAAIDPAAAAALKAEKESKKFDEFRE